MPKLKNPLRNYLTSKEQQLLLGFCAILLLGMVLDYLGWQPLQANQADPVQLEAAVKQDTPLNLDIRSASLEALVTLPGIGEKRAQDIIDYRNKTPFASVNQLLQVKGIGAKTYAKLLPYLLVFGDSTNLELESAKAKSSGKTKQGVSKAKTNLETTVNINTASFNELCSLSGIGEVKAKAIIAWREENGLFQSVDDITKVKGIGAKTLEKNRHRLKI